MTETNEKARASISAKLVPCCWAFDSRTRRCRSPATKPGRIAFTRMPDPPSSIAKDLVKPMPPHLAAA